MAHLSSNSERSPAAVGDGPLAPPAEAFPLYPISWYFFCTRAELGRGPVSRDLFGQRLVGFLTASGRVAVLAARCAHLGADLGGGRVRGENLQCPFHQWEYGADGRCARIPACAEIPAFARQERFPVVERHGNVFVFNGPEARFPLPFYPGVVPDDVI